MLATDRMSETSERTVDRFKQVCPCMFFRGCLMWCIQWPQTSGDTSVLILHVGCQIRGLGLLMEPTKEIWSSADLCESPIHPSIAHLWVINHSFFPFLLH